MCNPCSIDKQYISRKRTIRIKDNSFVLKYVDELQFDSTCLSVCLSVSPSFILPLSIPLFLSLKTIFHTDFVCLNKQDFHGHLFQINALCV